MSFLSSLRRAFQRPAAKRPAARANLGLTCLEGRSLPSATLAGAAHRGGTEHSAEVRHEAQPADARHAGQVEHGVEVGNVRREDRRADRPATRGADDPVGHDAAHPEARHGNGHA